MAVHVVEITFSLGFESYLRSNFFSDLHTQISMVLAAFRVTPVGAGVTVGPDCRKAAAYGRPPRCSEGGRHNGQTVSTASYPALQKAQGRGTHSSEREGKVETPKGGPPAKPAAHALVDVPGLWAARQFRVDDGSSLRIDSRCFPPRGISRRGEDDKSPSKHRQ